MKILHFLLMNSGLELKKPSVLTLTLAHVDKHFISLCPICTIKIMAFSNNIQRQYSDMQTDKDEV